jgi:endonuclease/exonuclease/phosphatase family metal-dependent hydrolase
MRLDARFRTILLWLAPVVAFGGGHDLSVVTLNLAKEPSVARMASELRSIPALRDADVFLLQEVAAGTAGPLGGALGLHAREAPETAGVRDVELAILSRYPLRDVRLRSLGRYRLVFHSRLRYALSAVVDTPWGAVRVVDTHLDTRINITDRLAQIEGAIAELPGGAAVVGGDFNSNPFFWIDHVLPLPAIPPQSARVEQHMRGRGFVSAIPRNETTFDYLGMHLDWIWLRGLRTESWRVYPLKFSDHHACWARVAL